MARNSSKVHDLDSMTRDDEERAAKRAKADCTFTCTSAHDRVPDLQCGPVLLSLNESEDREFCRAELAACSTL